jgi:hypothetical protein
MSYSDVNEDNEISKITNELKDIREKIDKIYNILETKIKNLLNKSKQFHIDINDILNTNDITDINNIINNIDNSCGKNLLRNKETCNAYITDLLNKVNERYMNIKNCILKELLKSIGFNIEISSEIDDEKLEHMINFVSELNDTDKNIFKDTFGDRSFRNNIEQIYNLLDTYYRNFVKKSYGFSVKYDLNVYTKKILFKISSYTNKLEDTKLFLDHILDRGYVDYLNKFIDNIKKYKNEVKNSILTEDSIIQQYTIKGISDLDNLFNDLNKINEGIEVFINCYKKISDLQKIFDQLKNIKLSNIQLNEYNEKLSNEISEKIKDCRKYEQISSIKEFINAKTELGDFEEHIKNTLSSVVYTINDLYNSFTKLQKQNFFNCDQKITEMRKYLSNSKIINESVYKQLCIYIMSIPAIDNVINDCIRELVNKEPIELDPLKDNSMMIIKTLTEIAKKSDIKMKLRIEWKKDE